MMRFPRRIQRSTLACSMLAATSFGTPGVRPADSRSLAPLGMTIPARRVATGRIEGTVVISAALTARRPQFRIYSDPGAGGAPSPAPRDPLASEVRNVILDLEGDATLLAGSDEQLASRRRGTIAQRDERFVPHVRAVTRGGTIDFPNDDDVFHNVYSLSRAIGNKGFD